MVSEKDRRIALGLWGERKALTLLSRAGFSNIRDLNAEAFNHPFADSYAERSGNRYLIGVKTRNKFQFSGRLNPSFNVRKKGSDVWAIARRYDAQLAWVAIQVVPENQMLWGYFGTVAMLDEHAERFSIPMRSSALSRYECLADEEVDTRIPGEWTNGGFGRAA